MTWSAVLVGGRVRRVAAAAVGAVGVLVATVGPAQARQAAPAPARHVGVRTARYDLGDRAFTVEGLDSARNHAGPMELTARVFYPSTVSRGRHPLVLIMPGYWITCADAAAQRVVDDPSSSDAQLDAAYTALDRWPCAKGTPPLPSYLGYDYVGRALARAGIVSVSVSANGANAIDSYDFQGDQARAALINEHLRLWTQFADSGSGPLRRFLPHRLVGHVDLGDVGLAGHSRAGRAVLQYASDRNRSHWPRGVSIRAVLGLAPAQDYGDPDSALRNTDTSVGLLYGGCDAATTPYDPYYDEAADHSSRPVYEWLVRGADHDFWNTQWSPSSGQVGAADDATHDAARPGRCEVTAPQTSTSTFVPELSEARQRYDGGRYVAGFFAVSLTSHRHASRLLDGRSPLPGVTTRHHGAAAGVSG